MSASPATAEQRSQNPLRPKYLADIIGQQDARRLMDVAINSCYARKVPLPHTLLLGPSGTGKSTFSHAIGNELGVRVFDVEAPVAYDTLAELRTEMLDGEILRIEEIHQQAIMERRGRSAATQPEVLYALMEDRVLQSRTGPLEYPHITIIGTTTDEGMLPDAFVNRFPLKPRLVPYTHADMVTIVERNAATLNVDLWPAAIATLARASRCTPREANNLVRMAQMLTGPGQTLAREGAQRVLEMAGLTEDGLTADMQAMLTFLYTHCRRETRDGHVTYQASVNTIATAIGKSRDSKAIALRVEPWLIGQGYVQVTHGGRLLTDAGQKRAKELLR